MFRFLEKPPPSMVNKYSLFFLQLNLSITDPNFVKIERIFGYTNSTLFGVLSGNIQLHFDDTFRNVPNLF